MNEKVVKMFELDGKRNHLKSLLVGKVEQIDGISASISALVTNKSQKLSDKKRAESILDVAISAVDKAKEKLELANKELQEYLVAEKEAQEASNSYGSEVFAALDAEIGQLSRAKDEAYSDKQGILSSIYSIESEMESLQAELKSQGIELNIGPAKTPKTSVI